MQVPDPIATSGASTCAYQIEAEGLEAVAGGPSSLRPVQDATAVKTTTGLAATTRGTLRMSVQRPRQRTVRTGATGRHAAYGPVPQGKTARAALRVGPKSGPASKPATIPGLVPRGLPARVSETSPLQTRTSLPRGRGQQKRKVTRVTA